MRARVPILNSLERVPGGMMLIPLVLGSVVGTFASGFLELGSFTTALFKDSALPLIALLILATGAQVRLRQSGMVLGKTGAILLCKTIIPGAILVFVLAPFIGLNGFLGISLVALVAAFGDANGGLWLALAGQYGDKNDRGAYISAALNDGPFFTLLFLGLSGLGDIPLSYILSAVLPFVIGLVWGNLDERFAELMKPVPSITIPFFAFALGAGIDLTKVAAGGLQGIVLGLLVAPITGGLVYLGYRLLLRERTGIGFASGTTAGNTLATPLVVAQADPTFQRFVGSATAQIGAAVLVTAMLAPLITHFMMRLHRPPKHSTGGVQGQEESTVQPAAAG